MTDLASLQIKVDSTQAKGATDDLNRLGLASSKLEGQTNSLGKTWVKASSDAGRLRMAAESTAKSMGRVTQVAGAQRAGMQQLGYQLGDVATMFSLGAKPAQIFGSQIGQVTQAVTQMTGGASKLAMFLSGPWGIALSVAAIALAPLIGKLFDTSSALDTVREKARAAIDELKNLAKEDTLTRVGMAAGEQARLADERMEIERKLSSRFGYTFGAGGPKSNRPYMQFSVEARGLLESWRGVSMAEAEAEAAIRAGNRALSEQEKRAGESARAVSAVASASRAAAGSTRALADGLTEQEKALEAATKSANDYIAALREETARVGLSAEALQRREVMQRALEAPTMELAQAIIAEGNALAAATAQAENYNDEMERMVKTAEDAASAAEDAVKQMEEDARRLADEALQRVNDQLLQTGELLRGIGGLGGVFGDLFSIAGGNFNVGSGRFGALASMMLRQPTGEVIIKNGKEVAELFGDRLGSVLKDLLSKDGPLGQTLGQYLPGIVAGMQAGRLVAGSKYQTTEKIGAAIGSAIGTAIAGPIGGAVGGALGSLAGGIFAGTPKGSVTFSGSGITGQRGGNRGMLDAAAGSANSILDSLADIAAALGGSVGSASGVSIGQRKGKWRVDPSGQGLVKGAGVLDFGDDAEAAAAYATKLLIERGVIGGVRESTQNLLKADGDLQAALDKALRWEDLMKEMATAANPFVAALNDLRGTFAGITDLAQEAGASTAELAKVQEFMVQRQQQLIDQAMASYRSTFFTDAENLAAAKGRIASTLGPLGHGSVDTVAEYKALVAATDALANPELFGALMELVDAFAAIKDAAEETAQAATEKIAVARAAVADAYARESSALSQTIDDATRAADRLREFRDSLASVGTAGANVNRLLAKVMTTGALAASGDLTAAGQLPTVGQDYLAAAKAGASSFTEYQRAVALVTGYANKAINANVSAADAAQRQLDAMTQEVEALSENTDTLVTLREAIDRLTALIGPGGNPASTPASQAGQRQVVDKLDGMHRAIEQSTVSVNRLRRLHEGWDRGGAQAVTSDSTQPVVTA